MSNTLTLPGDTSDLLRRGSPCVIRDLPEVPRHLRGMACTVHAVHIGLASVAVDGCEVVVVISLYLLELDLTDATGRAHATWWLAAAVMPQAEAPIAWMWCIGDGRWSLRSDDDWVTYRAPGSPEPGHRRPEVPALARLDPHDPGRLPDGSRWVDAEALRLVCLHVAGRAP